MVVGVVKINLYFFLVGMVFWGCVCRIFDKLFCCFLYFIFENVIVINSG